MLYGIKPLVGCGGVKTTKVRVIMTKFHIVKVLHYIVLVLGDEVKPTVPCSSQIFVMDMLAKQVDGINIMLPSKEQDTRNALVLVKESVEFLDSQWRPLVLP